jgi:hypothetical protein
VTEITPFKNFYVAEDYHKNYYENNQDVPYCSFVISPKVRKLSQKYGNDLKLRQELESVKTHHSKEWELLRKQIAKLDKKLAVKI